MNTLKAHRKARHLKQYTLADITGVSQARISQIEKQNYIPSKSHARILAAYFGVKIEAMFPDGVQTSPPLGRFVKGEAQWSRCPNAGYCPPLPKKKIVRYPREFYVSCRHCQTPIYMRTDDRHPVNGGALNCVTCGAEFEIKPTEGARA